MPAIGEIKKAKELGYKGYQKFIWHTCEGCGIERWARLLRGTPQSHFCFHCAMCLKGFYCTGEKHPNWKGGKLDDGRGYIRILFEPDNFFYPMANKGYILEHRLVMAQHLNRCLLPWEIIHHRNGNKVDNRLENLELIKGQVGHLPSIQATRRINQLEREILILKQRIATLEIIKETEPVLPRTREFCMVGV